MTLKQNLRNLYISIFAPSVLIDRQLVSFEEADALIQQNPNWELAKTDEYLLYQNFTFIELREKITS